MRTCFLILMILTASNKLFAEDIEANEANASIPKRISTKYHKKVVNGMILGGSYTPSSCHNHGIHEKICYQDFYSPVLGIDFGFHLSHHFELSLMADIEYTVFNIITESTLDETSESETIYQLVFDFALSIGWQPVKNLLIFTGPGAEFGHHDSVSLLRIGLQYRITNFEGWAVKPSFIVDLKELRSPKYVVGVIFSKKYAYDYD